MLMGHTIVHEDAMESTGGLTPPSQLPRSFMLPRLPEPDFISDLAVKVSSNLGERIFDSEDEEDSQV